MGLAHKRREKANGPIVPTAGAKKRVAKRLAKHAKRKVEDVVQRQIALAEILDGYRKRGISPRRHALLTDLEAKGFPVTVATLYRDRTSLNRHNSFIRDLTESNLSAYMEEIYDRLTWVEEEAAKQYDQKWTMNQVIKRRGPKGEEIEQHSTSEIAQPKAQFLSVISKAQELKHKLLVGDNTQLSAALLAEKFQKMKEELTRLQGLELEAAGQAGQAGREAEAKAEAVRETPNEKHPLK